MLSITGGRWRGRRLKVIERNGLRPTSSRVKASLFSILEALVWKRTGEAPDFSSYRCLDLFAGVGGLGLEMLSRGASHCVFVEKDRAHAKVLEENIASLGCRGQAKVWMGDVREAGWEREGPFDLVLLDPPYAESHVPELLTRLAEQRVVKPEGIVLFEHAPGVSIGEIRGFGLQSTRVLGPAGISVYLRDA